MYQATIARLKNVRKFPGADRIQLADCLGSQVVIGLDNYEDELGIMFPSDGQLSEEFAQANDLIARKDDTGAKIGGGFFDTNCRVRTQKFRGEKSDGFWCSLTYLSYLAKTQAEMDKLESLLVEGFSFNDILSNHICHKYYTPATLRAMEKQKNKPKTKKLFKPKIQKLPEHIDTQYIVKNIGSIPEGSLIWVETKLHGTSFRLGRLLAEVQRTNLIARLIFWVTYILTLGSKPKILTKTEYQLQHGTRRTIITSKDRDPYRWKAIESFKDLLYKGECVYGEIVGFESTGKPIMDVPTIGDKRLRKLYGNKMVFSYSCVPEPGPKQHDIYIYRICTINPDGQEVELSRPQRIGRLRELGLKPTPCFDIRWDPKQQAFEYSGPNQVIESAPPIIWSKDIPSEIFLALLDELVEGPDPIDSSHIREGVCVHILKPNGEWDIFKHKSWTFKNIESESKDNEDIIDTEEAESLIEGE